MQDVPDFRALEKATMWKMDSVEDLSDEGFARKKIKFHIGAGLSAVGYFAFLFLIGTVEKDAYFLYIFSMVFTGACILYVIITFYKDSVTDLVKLRPRLVQDSPTNVGGEDPRQYHEYFAMTPQFFLRKWKGLLEYQTTFIHPQKHDLAVYPLDVLETAEAYEKDYEWRVYLVFKAPDNENPGKKEYVQFTAKKEEIIRFFRILKDVCPTAPIPKEYTELPFPEDKI
jgi:hypothetical protein